MSQLAVFARSLFLIATSLALPAIAGCGQALPPECEGVLAPCTVDAECSAGDVCDRASCTCVPACGETEECRADSDCAAPMTCVDCVCQDPGTPLTAPNLATLTGSGLPASCHFVEERGCSVSTFDADFTVRVGADGSVELVQQPAAQVSRGAFGTGVSFSTRDSTTGYDELYVAVFERTAGTSPTAPLSPETVAILALNASGPEGSLAVVDATRIASALRDGAATGNTAAVDALLEGTTDVCAYEVTCTLAAPP